ncbi:MAG: hypothetical protein EHM23_32065 [Acidobacteria bacterium]|nr:MAG: hypothetical protein EHM23_32065 [Acidobacteriota bacterium]
MLRFGRSLSFVALVAVCLLDAGSQWLTAQSGTFPVGSYESGPFTITFKAGDNFEVTHSNGGGVTGTYKISGDQAEFTDLAGDYACPGAVGKYTWKVESEKLVFTLVDDKCDGRAEALSQPLAKKSGK